jgi:hypothetical protein
MLTKNVLGFFVTRITLRAQGLGHISVGNTLVVIKKISGANLSGREQECALQKNPTHF